MQRMEQAPYSLVLEYGPADAPRRFMYEAGQGPRLPRTGLVERARDPQALACVLNSTEDGLCVGLIHLAALAESFEEILSHDVTRFTVVHHGLDGHELESQREWPVYRAVSVILVDIISQLDCPELDFNKELIGELLPLEVLLADEEVLVDRLYARKSYVLERYGEAAHEAIAAIGRHILCICNQLRRLGPDEAVLNGLVLVGNLAALLAMEDTETANAKLD